MVSQLSLMALACVAGCAAPVQLRTAPLFHAASSRPRDGETPPGAVTLVERALRDRGVRFGTDGTVGALHHYLRQRHRAVDPGAGRPGDVVFFALGTDHRRCDHVGIVDQVDPTGRLGFREWRDGAVQRSLAHPHEPRARRDRQGRVLNTFLRVKRPEDPGDARYYAGEMLCAAYRIRR